MNQSQVQRQVRAQSKEQHGVVETTPSKPKSMMVGHLEKPFTKAAKGQLTWHRQLLKRAKLLSC